MLSAFWLLSSPIESWLVAAQYSVPNLQGPKWIEIQQSCSTFESMGQVVSVLYVFLLLYSDIKDDSSGFFLQ